MRQRTSYPKTFEIQIVQVCLQVGMSMASVALRCAMLRRQHRQAHASPSEVFFLFAELKIVDATEVNPTTRHFGNQALSQEHPRDLIH